MNTPLMTTMGFVIDDNPTEFDIARHRAFERSVLLEHGLNPDQWKHITNVQERSRYFLRYKCREVLELVTQRPATLRVLQPACSEKGYSLLDGSYAVYIRNREQPSRGETR